MRTITQKVINTAKIHTPYYRTVRQMLDDSYINSGFSAYIKDIDFAPGAVQDIRSFLIIQDEFIKILEFIEPATANNKVYSLQLRNLLMRICTEIESNLKAILDVNGYPGSPETWDMTDYCKIDMSHFLSKYVIYLPYWDGINAWRPFMAWTKNKKLKWYKAYNNTKHSRSISLKDASLENVVNAMTGLVALISAQFHTVNLIGGPDYFEASRGNANDEYAIGGYFGVKFPDISLKERYSLGIEYTQNVKHNYQKFIYP